MNDVATRTASTAIGALQSLKAGIANVQQTMVKKSGNPFLRMLKDGAWVYGQEDIDVETGSLWAANPLSIEHGWVAWRRGEKVDNSGGPLGEVMVPQHLPLPAKTSLNDVGADAPWEYQMSIEFRCLNGTDKGEQVLYKAASVGASKAMDDLIKAISAQLDKDETHPVPVVKFDSSTYDHKTYGKTYEPIIEVFDWIELSADAPEVADPVKPDPVKQATRSVPAVKQAETVKAKDPADMSVEELEAYILAKKKPAADPVVDEKAAARAKLLAELAAMDAAPAGTAQPAPAQADAAADGKPLRRRRTT